jgi:hypothetical protein
MNYLETNDIVKHQIIDIGFYCPLCTYDGKVYYHKSDNFEGEIYPSFARIPRPLGRG